MTKRLTVWALGAGLLLGGGLAVAQPMGGAMGGEMGQGMGEQMRGPMGDPMDGPMGGAMGRWWQRPQVAEQLALTPAQKQKHEKITLDGARAMVDLKSAEEKAQIDLRATSEAEPFQPDHVREAFHVLLQARQRLEMQRFDVLLKVRSVLSADQWQKLRDLIRERGAMRGREGGGQRGPRRGPNN